MQGHNANWFVGIPRPYATLSPVARFAPPGSLRRAPAWRLSRVYPRRVLAAYRPNSMSRVFSAFSSSSNRLNRSFSSRGSVPRRRGARIRDGGRLISPLHFARNMVQPAQPRRSQERKLHISGPVCGWGSTGSSAPTTTELPHLSGPNAMLARQRLRQQYSDFPQIEYY